MSIDTVTRINEFIMNRAHNARDNDADYGNVDYASISDLDAIRIACAIAHGAEQYPPKCIGNIACDACMWLGIAFPDIARGCYNDENTYAEAILGIVDDLGDENILENAYEGE